MISNDWQSQIFEKKKKKKEKVRSPNLYQMFQNRSEILVFCYFLKFGSLGFLEIA